MSKSTQIKSRIIFRKKSAVLLEYVDSENRTQRISVPTDVIKIESDDETVFLTEKIIDLGIPYGIPWEYKLKSLSISPEQIANALHSNGVWTAEDVLKHPDSVKNSLMSMLGVLLSSIVKTAREFISKES